jgi:transaldolase
VVARSLSEQSDGFWLLVHIPTSDQPSNLGEGVMMNAENRLDQVHTEGQSIWLDNLSRRLLQSGELQRLRDRGVTGITSNPTIFQKAISDSSVYDAGIRRLVAAGRDPNRIIWDLMIEDVTAAADILRPVYDRTGGQDGFVSIEVSPEVAHSAERTVAMVHELRERCARPNVMVKIPATKEGVDAIRKAIAEGADINVTLIFAVSRYEDVVEAFQSGLEELARKGGNPGEVHSVASFFVSRVDTKVDRLVDERLASGSGQERERLSALRGRIGIANSKAAYQRFKELHVGERWEALAHAGARPQRCLWASTSAKDPRYPDTMYVDNLIGPGTIDTLPEATLEAFVDHGEVRRSLETDLDQARHQLDELGKLGIDLGRVTDELEAEGVEIFTRSYQELMEAVASEVDAAQRTGERQ